MGVDRNDDLLRMLNGLQQCHTCLQFTFESGNTILTHHLTNLRVLQVTEQTGNHEDRSCSYINRVLFVTVEKRNKKKKQP